MHNGAKQVCNPPAFVNSGFKSSAAVIVLVALHAAAGIPHGLYDAKTANRL
jgi:hypothetical protein